jgi:hypothetical protein
MLKASLGMLKVQNLKAYYEMVASSVITGPYTFLGCAYKHL